MILSKAAYQSFISLVSSLFYKHKKIFTTLSGKNTAFSLISATMLVLGVRGIAAADGAMNAAQKLLAPLRRFPIQQPQ